jgi:HAD superfamily hydrolase (TIGR01459 family)
MTDYIREINQIIDKYDYFIIDLWGVIHDGSNLYDDAFSCLKKLSSKKIIFLSNSPKRSKYSKEMLNHLGIDNSYYDELITSGEYLYQNIDKLSEGNSYFHLGPDKNKNLFLGKDYKEIDNLVDADFILITGLYDDKLGIKDEYSILKSALDLNLKSICPNPDIIVVDKFERQYLCAGAIAKEYERMGGSVTYTGKPHIEIYDMLYEFIDCPKDKMIAIGDSLTTDIKGANNFGIDNILITRGILSNEIKNHGIENIFSKYNEKPTYYMEYLK